MKNLTALLAFFLSATAWAASSAVIFGPNNTAQTIPPTLSLGGTVYIRYGTAAPTSSATLGNRGSLYLRTGASGGTLYIKTDNGTSTNWTALSAASGGTFTGAVAITDATSSTSSTTGALKVTGGMSTQENLNVGSRVGIGTLSSTASTAINAGLTVTDLSSARVMTGRLIHTITSSASLSARALNIDSSAGQLLISSGVTNSGSYTGAWVEALRFNPSDFGQINTAAGGLVGGRFRAGHTTNLAAGATTAMAIALQVEPHMGVATTQITTMQGLVIDPTSVTPAADVGTYRGLYLPAAGGTNANSAPSVAGIVLADQTAYAGGKVANLLIGTTTVAAGSWNIYSTSTRASQIAGTVTLTASPVFSSTSSPASGAACTAGTFTWDTSFGYICTASGAWKRFGLTGGY